MFKFLWFLWPNIQISLRFKIYWGFGYTHLYQNELFYFIYKGSLVGNLAFHDWGHRWWSIGARSFQTWIYTEDLMSDWIGRKDELYLFFCFNFQFQCDEFLFWIRNVQFIQLWYDSERFKSKGTIESGNLKESVGVTNPQTFTGTNAWHFTYIELEHDYFLEEYFFSKKKSFRFQSSRLSDLIFDLGHAVSWDSALSWSAHLPIWEEYMKTPPPPEWDGVEHLKSKSFGCPKMEDPLWREVRTWPWVK